MNEDAEADIQGFYMMPPAGEESDGWDNSDAEDGEPDHMSRNLLKVCIFF
jgi:hypothetical protein